MWEDTDPQLAPPSSQGDVENMKVFTGKYFTGINCGLIKQAVSQKRLPEVWSWTSSRCITRNAGKEITLKQKNPMNKAATRKCMCCSVWHLGKCSCQESRSAWDLWDNRHGAKRTFQTVATISLLICKHQRLSPTTQPSLCTHRARLIKKLVWLKLERQSTNLLWLTPKLIVGLFLTQVYHPILL